jgi:DNA-binding response OmpR family regulator
MALEEGADDCLDKPFDPHELVACTRAVIRRARPDQPRPASAERLASRSCPPHLGSLTLSRDDRTEGPTGPRGAEEPGQGGDAQIDHRSLHAYCGSVEPRLTPEAVALPEYVMTHDDELLTRDRLLDAVGGWDCLPGTCTDNTHIVEQRPLLDDDPGSPRFIETDPGQDYRFVSQVGMVP